MSEESLLDLWALALGGKTRIENLRTVFSRSAVTTAGLTGTVEEWSTRVGNHKTQLNLGDVYRSLTVFDSSLRKGWVLDQNGKVQELAGTDLQAEITAAYLSSFSNLIQGGLPGKVEYGGEEDAVYKIKLLPQGGREVLLFLDKTTGLPVRQEQREGDRTVVLYFSDWREVEGIQFPFQLRQTTGDPKYDTLISVQEIRLNISLEENAFARPEEAAPDYRFTSGTSAVGIPFELNSNHIYVQVSVNGAGPFWFLFDTGADFPVLAEKRAKSLGLQLHGQLEGRGTGEGSTSVSLVKNISYQLPGVEILNQTAATIPLDSIESYEGRRIDGILGYDFISRFVVEIDYEKKLMSFYEPREFQYSGSGEVLPVIIQGNSPVIRARIQLRDKSVEGSVLMDTGSRSSLILSKPFHEANNLIALVPENIQAPLGFGVGGQTKQFLARIDAFHIGKSVFKKMLTGFSLDEKGAGANPDEAGILGGEILRRFTVTIDYSRNTVTLEPNKHFFEPFLYDASGMNLIAEGENFRTFHVKDVVANSPAAEAGIQAGDQLQQVDGYPANGYTLEQLRQLLKQEGKPVEFVLKRKEETLHKKILTRRLI